MRKIIVTLIILLIASTSHARKFSPEVGDLFHVTGCENGELMVQTVSLWDKPTGLAGGAKPIGKLSGTSKRRCQGAVVKLLKKSPTFLFIESIVNGQKGYITNSFVGKKFKVSNCEKHFDDPRHIERCTGEEPKEYVVVGPFGANLYAHPRDTKGFKKFKKGKKLEVLEKKVINQGGTVKLENLWYRVKYKKDEGWVSEHSLVEFNQKDWDKRN